MFVYSWKLAIIAIGFTVVYLFISVLLFPVMRDREEELIAKQAKRNNPT